MDPSNLIATCGIAFVAVFALLSFLAVAMRVITALFPAATAASDAAVVAAVSLAVSTALPGARLTRMEEEP